MENSHESVVTCLDGASSNDSPDEVDREVAELLSLLGKKHSLALLAQFAADSGPWRFSELDDELGISPNALSTRLSEFEDIGLVTRQSYDENPPRVEYVATEDAEDLRPIFQQLYEWGERRC
jgi:DNA-binding HxlR family transcriptional regulator